MESKNGDTFLLVRGVCPDNNLLNDRYLLKKVLRNLPPAIHMGILREPIISTADNNPGLEGYVPIDESNITISTYTKNPRLIACIHSCKDFDSKKVIGYLKSQYKCTEMSSFSCSETNFRREN